MNNGVRIGVGVAGGYLLGRTRKLRYAIGLGAWLLGKKIPLRPSDLAIQGIEQLRTNPEVAKLGEQVRNELLNSGRRAATAAATSRMDTLADGLRDRTESLGTGEGRDRQSDEPYPDDQEDRSGNRDRDDADDELDQDDEYDNEDDDLDDEEDDEDDLSDEYDDVDDDEDEDLDDEEEPSPRRDTGSRSRARTASSAR